ncbi:hypothetical protein R1flu_015202 [Riccia fluitans]|uniref:Uncharacterized protein n=1 Tax=Riccia fluitans TaxID=41844 RepID=A0ABD1YIQ4_9MARC
MGHGDDLGQQPTWRPRGRTDKCLKTRQSRTAANGDSVEPNKQTEKQKYHRGLKPENAKQRGNHDRAKSAV